jgi:ubiquinone/menaquinone biosynthesis C-methylase UbiE
MDKPQDSRLRNWRNGWKSKSKKFLEYNGQLHHPIREIIAKKTAEAGKSVLDVGCATCNDYPYHMKYGTQYQGRDITQRFIDRAKNRFPEIDVDYGDVLNLSFPDGSIDVVYCKDLLEHLPPKRYVKAIREMWRVAGKRVMLGFFISPQKGKTEYTTLKNRHWNIKYGKKDIMKVINALKPKKVHIIENIGYNKSALYVVDKGEN